MVALMISIAALATSAAHATQAVVEPKTASANKAGNGASVTGAPSVPSRPSPADFSVVIDRLQASNALLPSRLAEREAQYRKRLAEAKARVATTEAQLAAREAEGKALEARFDTNKHELDDKTALLTLRSGQLKELFGVFQQNASDLIGAFNGSATSLQYPDRDKWLEGFANRMRDASEVSSTDDIRALWFEVMREIEARGAVVKLKAPVYAVDAKGDETGTSSEHEIVRVGGFNLITRDPAPRYLSWGAGRQHVREMPRQPTGGSLSQIAAYLDSDDPLTALSVDPTGGTLVSLLSDKPTVTEQADQGGLVGYLIIALGLVAAVLAAIKLLDIGQIALRLAAQRRRLEQPADDNPLGRLMLAYHKHRQCNSETLELRLQEQVDVETDRVRRYTVFLVIIAAVAPLLGLLGTVVGMINTFQAITLYGTGDPQTMAGGISEALITTVLGLFVAVPAVLLNALVSARAKGVIGALVQQTALLLGDRKQAEYTQEHPAVDSGAVPSPA